MKKVLIKEKSVSESTTDSVSISCIIDFGISKGSNCGVERNDLTLVTRAPLIEIGLTVRRLTLLTE